MSKAFHHIAVIGAAGAIGQAITTLLAERYPHSELHAFSRTGEYVIDYSDEDSIAAAAELASEQGPLDLVIVATGLLHDSHQHILPEKSLRDLSADKFQQLFQANTITPALLAKYFLPKLNTQSPAVFAALSARVGSISDNHLGGWYAYRASKAALNMIIKTAAIELRRRNQQAMVVGLHPGTVDSELSKPFQGNVPEGQLFTPAFSAARLLDVLEALTPDASGKCFAWDGKEIQP